MNKKKWMEVGLVCLLFLFLAGYVEASEKICVTSLTKKMNRLVTVPRLDGGSDQVTVYGVKDFPYTKLDTKAMKCNNKRKCKEYLQTHGGQIP